MKKTLTMVVLLLVLCTASAWAQLKDGQWEITTQVQIAGMQQQMPPTTFRQCMTKSDPVAKNQDKSYDCKTTSLKMSGNMVNYTVTCTGKEGEMQTTGKSTYTGNTMDGSATTSFKMKGQPAMQMTSKMSGKYIGPCPNK
ncbi:MAG: DUF3617 domain-containing protein [Deltaproteobacteria bacterium]